MLKNNVVALEMQIPTLNDERAIEENCGRNISAIYIKNLNKPGLEGKIKREREIKRIREREERQPDRQIESKEK